MSTHIYGTCKIPTTDMRALLRIAQEIQRIEIPALISSLGAKHSLRIPGSLKTAINMLYENGAGSAAFFTVKKKLEKAVEKLAMLTLHNPTLIRDEDDASLFHLLMREILPAYEYVDFASILDLIEDSAKCRQLIFVPTRYGFTLMKRFSLTDRTRRWLSTQFGDYDFQNATDGANLREMHAGLDAEIEERISDFIKCDLKCAFGLKGGDVTEAAKIARGVTDLVKDAAASCLYNERRKVWDEAMGDRSYAESGLAYDIHGGWENEMTLVCKHVLRQACRPADRQDQKELATAIAEKEEEDAWKRAFLKDAENNRRELGGE